MGEIHVSAVQSVFDQSPTHLHKLFLTVKDIIQMPEEDSVLLQSIIASGFCNGHIFTRFVSNRVLSSPIPTISFQQFSLHFESRGKQLLIQAMDTKSSSTTTFAIGLSIRGFVTLMEKKDAINSKVVDTYFERDDGRVITINHAEANFVQYIVDLKEIQKRGPDPIREFDAFCKHVQTCFSTLKSSKPIGALMLNQNIFNGIGNFLRSEILYRANIPPFMDVLTLRKDAHTMERLLNNCRRVPAEIIEKFIKNGTSHSYYNNELQNWMANEFLKVFVYVTLIDD